ncbi:MAG: dipeptide epimerase [Ignavibacteriaceae bacterium]
MKISYYPYIRKLKDRFTISSHSRTETPAVMVEIGHNGLIGYGEAALPQYLREDQQSVIKFLGQVDLEKFSDPFQIESVIKNIDEIEEGNNAAKAAIDIALHDLYGKMKNIPLYRLLNIEKREDLFSSYTIGISDEESLPRKIEEASEFKFLKIKLGTNNDKQIINEIRSLTDKPLYVDVNQGWNDKSFALDMLTFLVEQNVVLVEQPFRKENLKDTAWLSERSPLPIIADEAVQSLNDLEKIKDIYSGVNIKLMKAGGISKAYQMILRV